MLYYESFMGIILAVLASIGIALGNVFVKKSFKDFSPAISFFIFSVFGMLLWLPFGLANGVQWQEIGLGLIGGLISAVFGQLAYIWVLSKGELSITGTILATYAIYTVILSVLFNGERLQAFSWLCVALAILGTLIISWPSRLVKHDLQQVRFVLYAILGAVAVGASDAFTKFTINHTSVGTFYLGVAIMQLLTSLIYLRLSREPLGQFKALIARISEYRYAIIGTLAMSLGTLCLFWAYNFAPASIVSPLSSTYPVATIFLAVILLRERITLRSWFGLACVIAAVLGIGVLS